MYSEGGVSISTMNRLEVKLEHERSRRKQLEREIHNLKKISNELVQRLPVNDDDGISSQGFTLNES